MHLHVTQGLSHEAAAVEEYGGVVHAQGVGGVWCDVNVVTKMQSGRCDVHVDTNIQCGRCDVNVVT